MEVRALNKSELRQYIDSEEYKKSENLPISWHRAISQINNPRVNENDALIILAEENGELLGYLGVLPDFLYPKNQPIIKVGWLSCIWVSAKGRGKGISQKLIAHAHFKWKGFILLTEYVPSIKRMYDASGFFIPEPLSKKGIRLYLKSDFVTLLPPKKAVFANNLKALSIVDKAFNGLLDVKKKSSSFSLGNLILEEIQEVDDEIESLIIGHNSKDYFQRRKREINWIINYPWVLMNDEKEEFHKKYYFTSNEDIFENKLFKMKDTAGKLNAFFFFTNRNGNVKLAYFYQNCKTSNSITAINYLLNKWDAKTFTTYHPKLVTALKTAKIPAFYKKEFTRFYLVDKQLSKIITHINLFVQDGDGDCAFT